MLSYGWSWYKLWGRGNQGQQTDMAEMRCMIEDLSLVFQVR